jgi:Rod binding domain-containing protein
MTPLAIDPNAYLVPYGAPARLRPIAAAGDKTRAQAQDFESMFISSMMQHMFTGIGNDGPLGSGPSVGPWRSLLTEQYAKSFVKAGGLGLAHQVYKTMLARQAAKAA